MARDTSHLDSVTSPLDSAVYKKPLADLNCLGVDRNIFKNIPGKVGRRRTQSLFEESKAWGDIGSSLEPVYSLKEDSPTGLPSLYKLYMEIADPTEYLFAQEAFGSWEHWLETLGGNLDGPFPMYIREYIKKWRQELEIKLRAEGIKSLKSHAKSKPAAALFFAEGQFSANKVRRGPGRPKSDEAEMEELMRSRANKEVAEDMSRLDL